MGLQASKRLLVLLALSCFSSHLCSAVDSITFSRSIRDPESLVSNRSTFRFGFFTPVNSSRRYVGIWYDNIPIRSVIWVANKDKPINDSSGVVSISEDGNLVIMDRRNQVLWSTDVSVPSSSANSTLVQLLDSGNLVLQDNNTNGETLWESFKHPCDSFLPKMTIGTNARTGEILQLTSWKSLSDPSFGSYTAGLDPLNIPELYIRKNNMSLHRSGPWNGQVFIGLPNLGSLLFIDGFNLNSDNQGTVSVSFSNDSFQYHFYLDSKGRIFQRDWDKGKQNWRVGVMLPENECDFYGKCGQLASCNSRKNPICSCIKGFEPKNPEEWKNANWTSGCVRRVSLQCERGNNGSATGKQDGFLKLQKMKVPDFPQRSSASEADCPGSCLSSCSCQAYAYDSGIGCMLWNGSIIDTQELPSSGVDLYMRLASSEIDGVNDLRLKITIPVVTGTFLFAICLILAWRLVAWRRALKEKKNAKLLMERMEALPSDNAIGSKINQVKIKDLPTFEIEVLATATDDFDFRNKLGQGGFGPVYKGKLPDGQEIAVKRLSRASGQGLEELMNEVVVISKLQHRNLVRLLGCCIEGEERMLVYEFMPKNSLDAYLFDPLKQELLDWPKRFHIIEGVCRGLLYLHRDSRLKIIHRDLKASNILLDQHLNPKISDFGMARIFRGNEDQANTRRVVGTYGYMSPEYAMEGMFSEKSDVFSLGVLLLEIVSSRKNSSFYNDEYSLSLLAYAWKLWNEDEAESLADPVISKRSFEKEIQRCVQIGLLCVQEFAGDRPSVSTVIWMLTSENVELPAPKRPAFIGGRRVVSEGESSERSDKKISINNVSLTAIAGR